MNTEVATLLAAAAAQVGAELDATAIEGMLATPKNPAHGDVSFPCFPLAKQLKKAPPAIATELLALLEGPIAASPGVASVVAVGPYLNFSLDKGARARDVLLAAAREGFGRQSIGTGKVVGIDYSSPNIAKPFGIGHLRSTAIGNALRNIHEALGYTVVGVNHLGDWGTQFGKLMAAFEERGDRAKLDANPIQHLYELYVWFHSEAEQRPELLDEGRRWFRKLESGDDDAQGYWTEFRALSLRQFERIYARLGVRFDHYWGEAFYEDKLQGLIDDLNAKGLLEESEGAQVVNVGEDMPPCLIQKSDGATLYATRDLAAAVYRYGELGFAKFLYVVGAPQTVHFRQVFRVLERMELEWADRLVHVPFGLIHGISTRKGTLVFLEDILDEGKERVRAFLAAEKPDYDEALRETIAEEIAIGAVVFYDLSRNRMRDYDFSWDHMLLGMRRGEKGNTGIKLQYTYARLGSVQEQYTERHGALPGDAGGPELAALAYDRLEEPEAQALIAHLERFPAAIRQAADQLEPVVISRYALELSDAFNAFYSHENKDAYRIVSDDAELSALRVALVGAARHALGASLAMLGVPRPHRI